MPFWKLLFLFKGFGFIHCGGNVWPYCLAVGRREKESPYASK